MRRRQILIALLICCFTLIGLVALPVVINGGTGGRLPKPLHTVQAYAWPIIGVLAIVAIGLAIAQWRLQDDASRLREPVTMAQVPAELLPGAPVFVGRTRELSELRALARRKVAVIAIVGPPGVGKSALALRFAHSLRNRYPQGQLYARLRSVSGVPAEPAAVLTRFLSALGAGEAELHGDVDALSARYRSRLAHRRVLVFLDDARDSAQLRPLLPGTATSLVVITSRTRLADCDAATVVEAKVLTPQDAHALFATVAGASGSADELEATTGVLEACGYLPLAIRIAAGRLRSRPDWSVESLATQLADEHRRLDELELGEHSVRASLAISYGACTDEQRRCLRRLSVFTGADFGPGAAIALSGLPPRAASAAVGHLLNLQLIDVARADRYHLHPLVRLFASEQLTHEEPAAATSDAVARLAPLYADQTSRGTPGWLDEEQQNIPVVLRLAVEAGQHAIAWRLANAVRKADPKKSLLGPVWQDKALWQDLLRSARTAGNSADVGHAHFELGAAYFLDGAISKAQEHLTAAAKSSRKARDRRGEAAASYALGDLLMGSLRPKDADEPYEHAMQLIGRGGFSADEMERLPGDGPIFTVQSGDQPYYLGPWTRFSDITQPGWSKFFAATILPQLNGGNPAPVYGEALHAFRASGDRFGEGYALLALGRYARLRSTRIRRLTKAAGVFRELAHPLGVGLVQLAMGDNCSDPGEMLAAYQQSAAIFHTLGDQAMEGLSLLKTATVQAVLGRWDDALKDWALAERLIADSRADIDVREPRMFLVKLTLRAGHEAGYPCKSGRGVPALQLAAGLPSGNSLSPSLTGARYRRLQSTNSKS